MRFIHVFLAGLFAIFTTAGAAVAAQSPYLFERSAAAPPDIRSVTDRSFKFFAAIDGGSGMKEALRVLGDRIVRAGTGAGYAFAEPQKGGKWKYAEKCYYDTADRALRQKGYVVREVYPRKKNGEIGPEKFTLTVKEVAGEDLGRLARSSLADAPGRKGKTKLEENISLDGAGGLQSYFEVTLKAKGEAGGLGRRALGDYAARYPALAESGLPPETALMPVTAHSLERKIGTFQLPGKLVMTVSVEGWALTRTGVPILLCAEADLAEDPGYGAGSGPLRAAEDFFLQVFGAGLRDIAMPGGAAYAGSKLRILLDAARP